MANSKSAKRWDARRKTAIERVKKDIEKHQKAGNADKLKKAEATLAGTHANMGKGLTGL